MCSNTFYHPLCHLYVGVTAKSAPPRNFSVSSFAPKQQNGSKWPHEQRSSAFLCYLSSPFLLARTKDKAFLSDRRPRQAEPGWASQFWVMNSERWWLIWVAIKHRDGWFLPAISSKIGQNLERVLETTLLGLPSQLQGRRAAAFLEFADLALATYSNVAIRWRKSK